MTGETRHDLQSNGGHPAIQVDLGRRPKKRRHHKSFDGCLQCKSKRIKCDERKPSCTRCLLSDFDCVFNLSRAKEQLSGRPPCPPGVLVEPCSAFGDPVENRALTYYNEVLLPDVTGFTSQTETFWRSLVPRLSHTEPAIHHILVAVASKHEALRTCDPKLAELTPVCAKYHSLALRCLGRANRVPNTEVALMSCIAFSFFERMRDPFAMEGACSRFVEAGLKILHERRVKPQASGQSDLIDNFLEPMFFQMELMLSMFVQPDDITNMDWHDLQPAMQKIPPIFPDAESATRGFFHIVARRYSLVNNGAEWSLTSAAFREVRALLQRWMAAFDAYLRQLLPSTAEGCKRIFYMREQACLLIGAMLFSARNQVPLDCFCRPVSVDLATPYRISITIRVHDAVKVNLSGMNTGTPSKIRDPKLGLWPHARYVRWEEGNGIVLMEFRGRQ